MKRKRDHLLDIEADEKVEGNIGLEAGGVDAQQLEHFPLPVGVEEDGAVEGGEEEVEDGEDDQVVVDQLQHGAPLRHNHLHLLGGRTKSFLWLFKIDKPSSPPVAHKCEEACETARRVLVLVPVPDNRCIQTRKWLPRQADRLTLLYIALQVQKRKML